MKADAPAVLVGPGGHYRLQAREAEGASGVTFRALREGDARPVIIKVLKIAGMPGWKALELFEREAAVLSGLEHRGIPRFLDHFPVGDPGAPAGFALVMSLVAGRDLRRVARAGGLGPESLLDMLADVLDVLAYLHGRAPPLIHRDVNPKNIIAGDDGRFSLVDFGSVQAALHSEGSAQTVAGTFGYAPQEQFLGRATPASDLYGLGMSLLAMASGMEPEAMPLAGIRVDARQLLGGDRADPRLTRLVSRMTEPDPRARLGDAHEAMRTLARLRGTAMPSAMVPARGGQAPVVPVGPWLGRLEERLAAQGFTIAHGGELGRSPLAFSAHKAAGLGGEELRLLAASALALEGGGEQPLGPVPAALFVQAASVAARDSHDVGFFGRLLAQGSVVVPLIFCQAGLERRTAGHVAATLREQEGVTVVPVLVDGREGAEVVVEIVTPRSLLAGDPRGRLARVRELLDS